MKKLYYLLAMVAIAGLSAFAISSAQPSTDSRFPLSAEQLAAKRNAHPRSAKATRPVTKTPLSINGGTDGSKPLYGATYYIEFSTSLTSNCVAKIDVNGDHTQVSGDFETMTGCYFDGMFLSIQYGTNYIIYTIYNTSTWEVAAGPIKYTLASDVLPFDLTYDPSTRRIFGNFVGPGDTYGNNDISYLGWINLDNALNPVTKIGDMTIDGTRVRMRGMAANKEGVMYGIGQDNVLYTINKTSGELTKVADMEYTIYSDDSGDPYTRFYKGYESAEFDWDTNTLYFSRNDSEGDTFISTIDLSTGKATDIANFSYLSGGTEGSEVFSSIFFMQQLEQSGTTPAAVSSLTATPLGIELKAKVEFDLPAVDVQGNAIAGSVEWTVTDGTNTLASGQGEAGTHVSSTVDVPQEGFCNFFVTAIYNSVASTQSVVRSFIGCDTPYLPTRPDVYPDGKTATIVWNKAASVNNGNLAPVTYRVVRMPDEVVIAEATDQTAIEDQLNHDNKIRCYYTVTPTSGSNVGETSSSRETYVGQYFTLPHQNTFDEELLFNQYPVIDANNDGNTWWVETNQNRQAAVYSGSSLMADDYLCVGPFMLDSDTEYIFQMTADNHTGTDRVAVYMGTDAEDASTFNHMLIEPTVLNALAGAEALEGRFTPETSGVYYFGIQACGDANTVGLYIYDIKISGISGDMPAAPTVTAEPGLSSVKLNITVPDKSKNGKKAANVKSLRIYRDGTFINEITDKVADGAVVVYNDTDNMSTGTKKYVITAVNEAGEGLPCTVQAYTGLDTPDEPQNMRVYEDLNTPGLIHVTWEAPAIGLHGGYIDPAAVSYTIDWLSLSLGLTGEKNVGNQTSFDLQLPEEACSQQNVIAFTVRSSNSQGQGGKETRSGYFGPAKEVPLSESWSGAYAASGTWSGESIKKKEALAESWWDYTDGSNASVMSQDGDGYFMALSTTAPDGGYRLRSPRMDISKTQNPMVAFYYAFTPSAKSYTVEIAVDDQPMRTLKELDLTAGKENEWHLVEISLNEFKNSKYIQFGFSGFSNDAVTAFACLDNFNVYDYIANDLAIKSFTGPSKAGVNESALFMAQVRNVGSTKVSGSDYSIKLYKNDKVVLTQAGRDIESYTDATFILEDYPLPTDPEQSVYRAEIEFNGDSKQDNNVSENLNVIIVNNDYPAPTNLTGESNGGVALRWNEPDMAQAAYSATTDGFDTYEPFLIEGYGDWSVYDGDKTNTIITATVLGVLDYPHIGEPMAWQIIDPYQAMFLGGAWDSRSGTQFIVSFQACKTNSREVNSNDWLISPELKGCEQTLSFYARAGHSSLGNELMDIYVSQTGTDISDFTLLAENIEVPYSKNWNEYRYRLPEGTKHFAIVHKSYDRFALIVDDISFIDANAEEINLKLLGYHVYRNNQRITDEPVSTPYFTDTYVKDGETYSYHVTAVWNHGESPVSNEVVIGYSSIAEIAPATTATISAENRVIKIDGAEGAHVAVYNTSGVCVASVTGSSHMEIPVASSGIYIVKVGNTIAKLAVR